MTEPISKFQIAGGAKSSQMTGSGHLRKHPKMAENAGILVPTIDALHGDMMKAALY